MELNGGKLIYKDSINNKVKIKHDTPIYISYITFDFTYLTLYDNRNNTISPLYISNSKNNILDDANGKILWNYPTVIVTTTTTTTTT
ncbi:hypothetical protein BCR32DRAFT_289915 [Anaeromyces robustus]|uniref:Uncharacterized protein n=1 Tax=Anaeromyces robustus TaxID=1754192 RepID=A0A1Y1XLJ1_9FUNG|nr:hypothetical protein BCR32DRAFT_289915 [Anaeromyces robustus]|eukprot:ORX86618.1 hypothetical protein BCR32DRAFT_289915 [Anaeromyces robustus]